MNGDEIYSAIVRGVRIGLGEIANQQMNTWTRHPAISDPKDIIVGQVWAEVSVITKDAPERWDWQPVATVPKDEGRKVFVMTIYNECPIAWTCHPDARPEEAGVTHWMPIPPRPRTKPEPSEPFR
jgi:hypothetical protein